MVAGPPSGARPELLMLAQRLRTGLRTIAPPALELLLPRRRRPRQIALPKPTRSLALHDLRPSVCFGSTAGQRLSAPISGFVLFLVFDVHVLAVNHAFVFLLFLLTIGIAIPTLARTTTSPW